MKKQITFSLILVALCILNPNSLSAQFDWPKLSAPGEIIQQVGNTEIKVSYERPSVRNRSIFGELVPWNKIWRTGAGPCTKLIFDKPVTIEGQAVPAGAYSLFSIPNPDNWMLIINTDTSLYGAYRHDPEKDVARFQVPVNTTERLYETFTIDIDVIPNNARLYISWDHTQVSFLLETQTDQEVMRYISEDLMTGKVDIPDEYSLGADYLLFHNRNLYQALELAEKSLAIEQTGYGWSMKVTAYEKLRLYEEAIEAAEAGMEHRRNNKSIPEEYLEQDLASWQKYIDRIKQKVQEQE